MRPGANWIGRKSVRHSLKMKTFRSKHTKQALTILEVLAIIFILTLLALTLFPAIQAARRKANRIQCVNNLTQLNLAFRIWEGDHKDYYPMYVSNTNGGAMEQATTGNVAAIFQVMSNEIATPESLICPADTNHYPASSFSAGFSSRNISYFINLDAIETNPQMLFLGDDNFVIDGVPVKSGILKLPTNRPLS